MPETWGIGVDLCAVSRMARAIEKAHFFTRVFTENERAYLQAGQGRRPERGGDVRGEGGRRQGAWHGFCAGRDAVANRGSRMNKAESLALLLTGAAREKFEQIGGRSILLSLSHEGDTAIAFALIQ